MIRISEPANCGTAQPVNFDCLLQQIAASQSVLLCAHPPEATLWSTAVNLRIIVEYQIEAFSEYRAR